jgi:hypothetical protein
MKQALLSVFYLLSAAAYAETWQKSYDNGEGVTDYVDMDSININDSLVTVSLKREYKDANKRRDTDENNAWFEYSETRSEITIDCKTSRITTNKLVNSSKNGKQKSVAKSYVAKRINATNSWDVAIKNIVCEGVKGPVPVELETLGIGKKAVMPQHYPNREVVPEESDLKAWYQKFQPGWYKIHEYQLDSNNDQPIMDTVETSEDCFTPFMIKSIAGAPVMALAFDSRCRFLQGELEDTLFYGRRVCMDEQNEISIKMAAVHLIEDEMKIVSHAYVLGSPSVEGGAPMVNKAIGVTMFRQGECSQ